MGTVVRRDSQSGFVVQIPDSEIRRIAYAMKVPILVSMWQAALMFTYTVTFFSSPYISNVVFEKLHFFNYYIPALYRYSSVMFAKLERTNEFHAEFSMRLFDVILQSVVLVIVGIFVYCRIQCRRPDPLSLRKNILFLLLLLFLATPSIDVFVGISDLDNPGFFSNIYIRCLTVPGSNSFLCFIVYARFWESHFRRAILKERSGHID
jgi:hypothetical protein